MRAVPPASRVLPGEGPRGRRLPLAREPAVLQGARDPVRGQASGPPPEGRGEAGRLPRGVRGGGHPARAQSDRGVVRVGQAPLPTRSTAHAARGGDAGGGVPDRDGGQPRRRAGPPHGGFALPRPSGHEVD